MSGQGEGALRPGWGALAQSLSEQVLQLSDGATVLVRPTEYTTAAVVVREAQLFGLVRAKRKRNRPEVLLTRQEDHLRVECSGADSFGGTVGLDAEQLRAMTALGWRERAGLDGRRYGRYWPDDVAEQAYLPPAMAEAAAVMVVRTVSEVYGCPSPEAVETT